MNQTMSRMAFMIIVAFLSGLIIWIINGTTVAGMQFRKTTMTAAAIDDINNTIASYIQKNGGYFNETDEGKNAREEFENNLIALHHFDRGSSDRSNPGDCKQCVNIDVKKTGMQNNKVQRSTEYTIKIQYRYFQSVFKPTGFDYHWQEAHPRVSKAYVHRYINDGNIND